MGLGIGGLISFSGPPGSGTSSGGSSSGIQKYAANFSNVTSGVFMHGLGTIDVMVTVYDDSSPREQVIPDRIILNGGINFISLLFNRPFSGRVVICG